MFGEISLTLLIGRVFALLLAFTIHEWAHAYAAVRLGGFRALPDYSRLSLDPRVHLDPVGTVMALLVGVGWAKPVPVNPSAFYPNELRGMMITAFAGPLSNLIIAAIFAFTLRIMDITGLLVDTNFVLASTGTRIVEGSNGIFDLAYDLFAVVVLFNLLLFLFNLIPLAPLDGWKIMLGLVPPERAIVLARYEQRSTYLLLILMVFSLLPGGGPIGVILLPLLRFLFELLTGFAFFL